VCVGDVSYMGMSQDKGSIINDTTSGRGQASCEWRVRMLSEIPYRDIAREYEQLMAAHLAFRGSRWNEAIQFLENAGPEERARLLLYAAEAIRR